MNQKQPLKISKNAQNKKIFFNENGDVVDKPVIIEENKNETSSHGKIKSHKNIKFNKNKNDDVESKWHQLFEEYNGNEFIEIKTTEFNTFEEFCKKCFNEEVQNLGKNNPSDSKWLETALHKGTIKDRANAGALLFQTNPLPNLSALDTLITLTKFSNKNSADILETVTNLFITMLPSHRKLIFLQQRGNDWKQLKGKSLETSAKNKIYAYWYFESELKDRFNVYLQNLQGSLQNGKEINKIKAILSASNLLKNCPEREAFLLTILVNKFGDPDKKVASKVTYQLRQILLTHPNMAHVMIIETEKLIFRNNVNDLAQHYGIGFLSLIAPIASVQSSQKLINICFCFFKIKIEKGDINSKTMQSILNCIRIAIQNINDYNQENKRFEITTPDVVNTIYRLIYLSNISIAFQALSLLLQLVLVQNENQDRFYNALYKKMLDPEIFNANSKITSLYFHIIHRSVFQDSNVPRCKAFIKRLLQMTLAFSPSKACGALIVISKILKSRPELRNFYLQDVAIKSKTYTEIKTAKYEESGDEDDDGEEKYQDVKIDDTEKVEEDDEVTKATSSWIHVKNNDEQKAQLSSQSKAPTSYDPYKRSAAFCGAELSLYYEITLMAKYFHPTVQVFVSDIMKNQKFKYIGDPLKDFSLAHFLERFSFKNPKKVKANEEKSVFKHAYQPKGSRGQSVYTLTEQSCTEDERFIFDFIQRKREIRDKRVKESNVKEEDEDDLESVNDDEFDDYLDTLGAKKDFDASEKDFDYLSELQNDLSQKTATVAKKKKSKDESDDESIDDDGWNDDEEDGDVLEDDDDDGESGTDQSIDEDELDNIDDMDSDDDDEEMNDSDEGEDLKPSKKIKSKNFSKERGINDLFVAVDDFSEIIEKNSSNKNGGTLGEIFNKDKSSQKQLAWESKRHNQKSGFKRKNSFGKKSFGSKKKRF